jgi:hypothetical protein
VQDWCAYLGQLVGKPAIMEETEFALPSVAVDVTRMDASIGPSRVHWREGMRRMVASSHPEIELPAAV